MSKLPKDGMQKQQGKDNPLDQGKIKPISTGLTLGEIDALEQIMEKYKGVTRSGLMRYIIRSWLEKYQAGEVELPVEKSTQYKLDI